MDQDTEVQGSQSSSEAELEAAFLAGFGEEPSAAVTTATRATQELPGDASEQGQEQREPSGESQQGEQATQTDPENGGEAAAQPAEAEPKDTIVFEDMTASQLKERLAELEQLKAARQAVDVEIRKLNGRLGAMNDMVQQLRKNGSGPKVSAAQLKRLSEDYPGVAEALAADLANLSVQTDAAGKPTVEPEQIEEKVNAIVQQRIAEVEFKQAVRELDRKHPDRADVLNSVEYRQWLALHDPEVSQQIQNVSDPEVAGKVLSKFKEWRAAVVSQIQQAQQAQPAAVGDGKKPSAPNTRLAAAARPSSNGVVPPKTKSLDEIFEEAFNQA